MLARRTLDVWQLRFDDARMQETDWAALDAAERSRSRAFKFADDGRRFAIGRAFLRRVLGLYLHRPPQSIALRTGPHGKPAVAHGTVPLRFNVSHSRTTFLLAVTEGVEIGVDVEDRRPVADREMLARTVLTASERRALAAAPAADRDDLFLRCWTRKEAVLKAAGTGLSVAPDRIDAWPDMAGEATVVHPAADGPGSRYRLLDLSRDAVIATLAVPFDAGPVAVVERRDADWQAVEILHHRGTESTATVSEVKRAEPGSPRALRGPRGRRRGPWR